MTTKDRPSEPLRGPVLKMADIAPFHVMDILGRARELKARGRKIIHMEIGEPDFPTPEPITEAGIRAIRAGYTKYTTSLGLPELKEAIAGFYRQRRGVDIPVRRIAITPGASGALQVVLATLIEPGDEVVIADPGYPCNRNMIRLFDGNAIDIPVGSDTNYQLTPDLISRYATPSTSAIVLTTPSNPTGAIVPLPNMAGIIEEATRLGTRVVVDEIYLELVYDAAAKGASGPDRADIGTAATLSDEVFVISGFSKYFGMTGWRLGWVVLPEPFLREFEKLAQNLYLSAPTMAQHAALAAFRPETLAILEERRKEFQRRRDFLLPALRDMGFRIPVEPRGAFYLYADCSHFTKDSLLFAYDLLENAGVAITPGIDFGKNASARYVRFAYTTGMENLQEGVERLRRYLSA
uniref:Aminotransferase n=1 Tax=Candidatus Kentrum sp. LPFa TaxID=2126335 RepID=A0A450VYJ9_9GAMM|nr:MAG: Aspartate/methionine/tyrosine aminotransferase [Candidatus Kentron sp. LPFa]VFK25723.1 MAG: Aspartate/methionine/tyrosine aminotransferase [Candidatus Kentron sp. LPFa]